MTAVQVYLSSHSLLTVTEHTGGAGGSGGEGGKGGEGMHSGMYPGGDRPLRGEIGSNKQRRDGANHTGDVWVSRM